MLVLTRKLMEKLYIGNDVCVTVVRLEGGQVRLGIDAPREVSVVRAELIDGRVVEPQPAGEWPTLGVAPGAAPAVDAVPTAPLRIRSAAARGIDNRRP